MNFGGIFDFASTLYCLAIAAVFVVKNFFPDKTTSTWYIKVKGFTDPVINLIHKLFPSLKELEWVVYLIAVVAVKLIAKIILLLFFTNW